MLRGEGITMHRSNYFKSHCAFPSAPAWHGNNSCKPAHFDDLMYAFIHSIPPGELCVLNAERDVRVCGRPCHLRAGTMQHVPVWSATRSPE